MWKTLFGKKKTDKEIEKMKEQSESGDYKFYPILKPGDWVGIQAGALKQTLIGTQEEPQVVVGFGYDTPENFIFLTHQDLEKMDGNQILNDAYQNLEDFKTEFEPVGSLDNKVLTSSGLDFSSERILSKNHMLEAHKMLDAEELLVSIARRRCMMVTSRAADDELLNTFIMLHNETWNDDSYGNAPIANMLFVVKEGDIVGSIPLQ
ncbi:hypothetical protein V6R21_14830 [Limibacter armeniacum]|uniref:hypothetical protein n=1 Tax=Limibacter armeniacum TaxID=466084 RepID=UPI002FE5F872